MAIRAMSRFGAVVLAGSVLAGCGKPEAPAGSATATSVKEAEPSGSGSRDEKGAPRAGAATPEELISRMDAAGSAGDLESLAVLFDSPGDAVIRERVRMNKDILAKLAAVEKEITAKFGPSEFKDPLPFNSFLAEKVMQNAFTTSLLPPNRKNPRTKVVSKEAVSDSLVTLKIETTLDVDGEPVIDSGEVQAIRTSDGWKLVAPKGDIKVGELPEKLKLLVDQLEMVREEVADNWFMKRSEAEDLVAAYLVTYMPSVLRETEHDSNMKVDAERLHLLPAPPLPLDVTPEPVTLAVSSDEGDHAHVSTGFDEQEIPNDQIVKQISELVMSLDRPTGYPVRVVFRKGVRKDWILATLHALVDLRASTLSPQIELAPDDVEVLNTALAEAKGRLRLLFVYPPEFEPGLGSRLEELVPERPRLEEHVEELKLLLEKEREPELEVLRTPDGEIHELRPLSEKEETVEGLSPSIEAVEAPLLGEPPAAEPFPTPDSPANPGEAAGGTGPAKKP